MDINIIIISAIIIAICVLPVIAFSRKQKKKKQHFANILSKIAETKERKIKSYEISAPIAIGLTENDEYFVYYHKHENGNEEQACILLSDIKQCNMVTSSRASGSGNIGKLSLTFESYDKSKPDITLDFFDAAESFLLRGELEFVEKWKPLIDAAIDSKAASRKVMSAPKSIKPVAALKTA